MNATILVDESLRSRVSSDLNAMATAWPQSIAAAIKPECWEEVVAKVAEIIDLTFPCFESALIAATGKVRERFLPRAFYPRRPHPNQIRIWNSK